MLVPDSRSWRLPDPGALVWRSWDDESVVYDSRSGDMHLLDAVARAVLRALEAAPATAAELGARVLPPPGGGDAEWTRRLEPLLAELEALGLIESDAVDPAGARPAPAR